jgi:hypothetical protein
VFWSVFTWFVFEDKFLYLRYSALGMAAEILFHGFFCHEKDCSEQPGPPFSGGERPNINSFINYNSL